MAYLTRKSKKKYVFDGGEYTLPEIIERSGCELPYQTIYSRLTRQKWGVYRAITTPSRKLKKSNPKW